MSNEDSVRWEDAGDIDELIEMYAMPGEVEYLAEFARAFPGVDPFQTPATCLADGVLYLLAGQDDQETPLAILAEEAFYHLDAVVDAWRYYAALSPTDRWRIIEEATAYLAES